MTWRNAELVGFQRVRAMASTFWTSTLKDWLGLTRTSTPCLQPGPNPPHAAFISTSATLQACVVPLEKSRLAGVTVPTTRKILATLQSILAYAVSQDWIATNPAHRTRVIGPRGEGSQRVVPPSKMALKRIVDAANEEMRLMLIFAASTGVRAGE
jgi:hypothetical protein